MPTLKDATGSDWTMAAWRGIAAPKGLPEGRRDKLVAAIKKICDSKEYTGLHGVSAASARPGPRRTTSRKFMAKADADLGATMKARRHAK